MALVLADRVQETSSTTGTGTLTLAGAVAGFQTFAAGIGAGNTCYYTIQSTTGAWEVGVGTVGTGTLARTTLISSSSGSFVSFTGTLTVFVTYPAEKSVYGEGTVIVAPTGALLPIASGGTGASTAGAALTNLGAQPAFGSQTANTVYAAPDGSAGTPTFRAIVAADVPTLNQNTTGTASNVTGTVAIGNGGTGASTAATARTALGLGTIATQDANAVAVTGGSINGTTVGSTTAAAGSFTTLNSSGATRLGGLSGNQSLQVNNVASAVNYAQIVGAVTGGAPVVSALGTDTDIGLTILGKGSGAINVGGTSGANPSLSVATVSSQVNSFQVYGNSAGNSPTLAAIGSDTNIAISIKSKGTGSVALQSNNQSVFSLSNVSGSDFTNYYTTTGNLNYTAAGGSTNINFAFASKGTGAFNFATGGGRQAQITSTASAVNYLSLTGAATLGAPELSAQGSDANINVKLTPKGTGVLQFGTYTAGILAQAGYITITDAGGTSRRLLVG